jgi:hypothetical protein
MLENRGKYSFYFSGYRFADSAWWDDETDDMERGLPTLVKAVTPGRGAGPVARLIKGLEALVSNTPVRGLDVEEHYPNEMAAVLNSPGGRHLRWLAFSNGHQQGQTGPVIEALINSPIVPTLERLTIDDGLTSDDDALALAGANFEQLRRLDLPAYCGVSCSAKAVTRLMTAPWFRNLQQLRAGFSEDCCETAMNHLAGMTRLHSLTMWKPLERHLLAIKKTAEFRALRRLYVYKANLTGKSGEAFCKLQASQLLELWLDHAEAKAADLRALMASPLFDNLRVLTFARPRLNEAGLEALADSVCARGLRILRLHCGDSDLVGSFGSLAATSLTRPGAFPEVTTLQLVHPYSKKAKKDTAAFLMNLATPNLRHLTLDDCAFDDECAKALATCPTFVNLTRLAIDQGYGDIEPLTPKAVEAMFRSPNLQNLVELNLARLDVGKALDVLSDESIMPKLVSCSIRKSNAPERTIERLKMKRPNFFIGS